MGNRCRDLGGEEGSLWCRMGRRMDSFDRHMDRREAVAEEGLLDIVFPSEILVGKVGLDQYRRTVGREVDCMPFSDSRVNPQSLIEEKR